MNDSPSKNQMTNISTGTNIQELIKRANEIYEEKKSELEPASNGKYVAIEVDASRYFVGETRDEAVLKAKQEFPGSVVFVRRVGEVEKASRRVSYFHHKYARLF